MLAGWLLAQAGLPVPEGVLTLAPVRREDVLTAVRAGAGWRLSGTAARVPWARDAAASSCTRPGRTGRWWRSCRARA